MCCTNVLPAPETSCTHAHTLTHTYTHTTRHTPGAFLSKAPGLLGPSPCLRGRMLPWSLAQKSRTETPGPACLRRCLLGTVNQRTTRHASMACGYLSSMSIRQWHVDISVACQYVNGMCISQWHVITSMAASTPK